MIRIWAEQDIEASWVLLGPPEVMDYVRRTAHLDESEDGSAILLPPSQVPPEQQEIGPRMSAAKRLRDHPEVGRALHKGRPDRLESPNDVLAAKYELALECYSQAPWILDMDAARAGPEAIGAHRLVVGDRMAEAAAYLWEDQLRDAAIDHEVPQHAISRTNLPHLRPMWFTWRSAVTLQLLGMDGNPPLAPFVELESVLVVPTAEEFQLHSFGRIQGRRWYSVTGVRYGAIYPDETPAALRVPITLIAFLEAPFVDIREPARERTDAKGKPLPVPSDPLNPRFVRLREHRPGSTSRPPSGLSKPVDWQWQWIVDSYQRNQFYPSTGEHKLIWVREHLKGPEGKPLKPRVYHVEQ